MREYLNEHTIADTIRLARQVVSSTFLIVEGDTDSRVYKNFFGESDCQTQVAYNKSNAIKALQILQNDNLNGILAIVDADFDVLEKVSHENKDIFLTDFHDLECLIFTSPALEKVLAEFASDAKIKSFGKNVRETILEIGCFIGYLRWLSLSDGLNLKFEELDFGKFIGKDNLRFDLNSFITKVIHNSHTEWAKNKSQKPNIDNFQIASQVNNLASQNHSKTQVVCGKDLVEILSLALQKVLGTNNSNKVTSEIIARDLRLAYEFEFFATTNLYQNVKIWEGENTPFRVFR